MRFDYTELKRRIQGKYGSMKRFCAVLGMTPKTLSHKMTQGIDFSQQQMVDIIELLDLDIYDISRMFFTPAVSDYVECKDLKTLIIKNYGTVKNFTNKLNVNESYFTRKLNGRVSFKAYEISKYVRALNIKDEDIDKYFFPDGGRKWR